MPSISQITNPASLGAGIALPLLGVAGPVGAAVAGAIGLVGLIDNIGAGRRVADKMTGPKGAQGILNKQLATIANSAAGAQEKAQATDKAWQSFLGAANQFASTQGARAPQVVQQAIYKTPGLTNTVNTLLAPLGKTALDPSYTSLVPGLTADTKVQGASIPWAQIATTAAGIAAPFAINALSGAGASVGQTNAAGDAAQNLPGSIGTLADTSGGLPGIGGDTGGYLGDPGTTVGAPSADTTYPGSVGGPPGATIPNAGGGIAPGPSGTGGVGGILRSILGGGQGSGQGSLLQSILPTLISSGTSLLGAGIGANASGNAAALQAQAANSAAQLQYQSGQNALQLQRDALNLQQQNLAPWLAAGQNALQQISAINATPYQLPTAEQARQTPGYQFALDQGSAALQAYERASGLSLSGKAAKDITQFGTGLADQNYGNLVNQQLAARAANINPILATAGLGQSSVAQANSALGTNASLGTQTGLQTAANVGNLQQQAAQASASGYLGQAQNWQNAIGNIGNTLTQNATIAQLLQSLKGPNAPGFGG